MPYTLGRLNDVLISLKFSRQRDSKNLLGINMADDAQQKLLPALRFFQAGDLPRVVAECEGILQVDGKNSEAWHLLGLALLRNGRCDEACPPLEKAITLSPHRADYQNSLGAALAQLSRTHDAVRAFSRATEIRPDYTQAHVNLATALQDLGRVASAEQAARKAIALDPENGAARNTLGIILRKQGRLYEAARLHRQALRLGGDIQVAWIQLAGIFQVSGRTSAAIRCFKKATAANHHDASVHSSLLYALHYEPAGESESSDAEHRAWVTRHVSMLEQQRRNWKNDRNPERRLRIGYVSADFREHSVMRFLEPLIRSHDRKYFSVCCYSDVKRADDVTRRVQTCVDLWRDIRSLTDRDAAELVQRDRIDILIDPTGHMSDNRMLVFARKPAPLQVAFPGYPGTCGLTAMDGFVTDRLQNPSGSKEHYTEKLIRLDCSPRCYHVTGNEPEVRALPSDENGHITFGSFNRLLKVTPWMIGSWSTILKAVPRAKLVLYAGFAGEGEHTRRYDRLFSRSGVDLKRIEFVGTGSRNDFMNAISRVDIALDTFPYNGCTTTCDALWMGVPTVTLIGQVYVSRVGLSVLHQVGLADLASNSPEEYLQKATTLAADLVRLQQLRRTLRETMRRSPLCDAVWTTRSLETELKKMWRQWCAAGVDLTPR